jgi:hypothetical protein
MSSFMFSDPGRRREKGRREKERKKEKRKNK